MATPKSSRNAQYEGHRRGRSSSFHTQAAVSVAQLRRPQTVPDLPSLRSVAGSTPDCPRRKPPKVLLKVAVQRSLSPVQLLMTPESTVGDLIVAALRQYVKESRRPILPANTASEFDLHYSQFSLESLDRKKNLVDLGSRNFFLCPRNPCTTLEGSVTTPFTSCAKEMEKLREKCGSGGGGIAWYKLMQFMM
ncbi:hypothetical protein ACSQ67_010751 [Phaseolus vulgaris]|uniref:DUF7054 domain-containing protein n=1 Tax=Phaseolus vulgaris TaxID=3885 RepID=T2DPI0_PHAVU|nr:hypothetical protein [Phaseolus vulgaris]